jgi:hypothetical protein
MNEQLQAIADAMDKNTNGGRNREHAVALADSYVTAHPEVFAGMEHLDLDLLVDQLSKHRDKGDDEKQWNIEAWLLHHYPPQKIGGAYEAEVRIMG